MRGDRKNTIHYQANRVPILSSFLEFSYFWNEPIWRIRKKWRLFASLYKTVWQTLLMQKYAPAGTRLSWLIVENDRFDLKQANWQPFSDAVEEKLASADDLLERQSFYLVICTWWSDLVHNWEALHLMTGRHRARSVWFKVVGDWTLWFR